MKVKVEFFLDVDWCEENLGVPAAGDPETQRIERSVAEAITNAVECAQDYGHCHAMENVLSILLDSPIQAHIQRGVNDGQ